MDNKGHEKFKGKFTLSTFFAGLNFQKMKFDGLNKQAFIIRG
jgi:hypothetical protein